MEEYLNPFKTWCNTLDIDSVKEYLESNIRTIVCSGVCLAVTYWMLKKPRGIPPGPRWTLPIIGDLLSLKDKTDDGDIRLPLRRLRKQYGDIYSVYMGNRLFIVINGYENINELLVKSGDIFSDRPQSFISEHFAKYQGIGSSSGVMWKEQRKFALETLREFGFGRTIMEDKIHHEIEFFIEEIQKRNGEAFDISDLVKYAVSNVICNIVFGQRFEYADQLFQKNIRTAEENFAIFGATAILNLMPFLRFLPGDLFNFHMMTRNVHFQLRQFIAPYVDEKILHFNENDTNDFIGRYIQEMKKNDESGKSTTINRENLIYSVNDLFLAGTETTSTTIHWTILYFLHYPQVLARCYKEVQDVVGSGRLPAMKDKANMPYLEAVITEILRLCNIAILNLPRAPVRDVIFKGYLIPQHSAVIPNLDSVLGDDAVWGDADTFRPERFLDDSGNFVKPEKFIPFSIGRRNCLGESMARMELFLFLSTLIQRFDFKPVDPDHLPTLKGLFGVTHLPRKFLVKAIPR